jgi:hypothetical protein
MTLETAEASGCVEKSLHPSPHIAAANGAVSCQILRQALGKRLPVESMKSSRCVLECFPQLWSTRHCSALGCELVTLTMVARGLWRFHPRQNPHFLEHHVQCLATKSMVKTKSSSQYTRVVWGHVSMRMHRSIEQFLCATVPVYLQEFALFAEVWCVPAHVFLFCLPPERV